MGFYFKKFQKLFIHFCLKFFNNYNVYQNKKPLNFLVELNQQKVKKQKMREIL